jgi:hypothetical protein
MAKSNRMPTPTLSPAEISLQRVLTVSRLNGWSVVVISALGSLLALAMGDLLSALIGLLVLAAGLMEVRGHRQLQQRNPAGLILLVRSQLFLLAVMLVYCAGRLGSFDADTALASLTPDMEVMLAEAGLDKSSLLPLVRTAFFALYSVVAAITLIYQGGLALFYRSKIKFVTQALTAPPSAA